jgi:GNAT superfamily N-acetyltransferase
MALDHQITTVRCKRDLAAVASLFKEYSGSLPVDLAYQDFEAELVSLPGKYAPPSGELLLSRDQNEKPLGCVGLRPILPRGCCEMKRLFIVPEARGTGLGRAMAEAIVGYARILHYTELYLDTLPTMTKAIEIYDRMGFDRIEAYYEPTPIGTVFMRLKL